MMKTNLMRPLTEVEMKETYGGRTWLASAWKWIKEHVFVNYKIYRHSSLNGVMLNVCIPKTKLLLACITVATLVTSCTSIDGNVVENSRSRNLDFKQIKNLSQKRFLIAIDSINQNYIKNETRISMKDVSNASRFVLVNVIADGIGGCVGAGMASWITGAAASYGYDKYLSWCERQMTRSFVIAKDIEQDKYYNSINDSIKLIFCENNPKTAEDSIGLMHNKILNATKLLNNNYNVGNGIDYNQILADVMSSANNLGVSCDEREYLDKVKLFAFYDRLNAILSKSRDRKKSNDIAYNELEVSLKNILGKDKAKFITVLSKAVFSCLGQDIELETLLSYSKNIDSILKDSDLSEDDMKDCKKLLQTMISSYTFWKSYTAVTTLR